MVLSVQDIEKMQSVDIGAVNVDALADVSSLRFDNTLSREDRVARLLYRGENPYCFRFGDVGIKIEFTENGPPLQDALANFLIRQKNGL